MPNSPRRRRAAGRGEPGLEADLAEAQAVVRAEGDLRGGDQRDPLPAGVLEQVARQLRGQDALVALELLAVVGREPYGILVRRIGPRQRLDLVLLHLARELAGDLDRAHLGLEGTRERALDEAGQLGLEVAQDAHRGPSTISRGSSRGRSQASAPAATAPATRPRGGAAPAHPASAAVPEPRPAAHAAAATKSIPAYCPRTSQG